VVLGLARRGKVSLFLIQHPEEHQMKVIKVKIKGAGMGFNAYTSVVHGADLANPVRVGADVLTMLLAHELD
jgi:hypothetical protein